jgi:hypothetical protein
MSARLKPTQSELVEDTLLVKPSVEVPAIRLADLKNNPTGRSSLGYVDPLGRLARLEPLAFARYLITFSFGVAVALAWQSYGNTTRDTAALKAISLDRDAVRQSLDRIANGVATSQEQMTRRIERGIDRLAAGQEQTTRDINDLQTVEQYVLDRISTLQTRLAPTAASKPVLRSPQVPMMRSNIP